MEEHRLWETDYGISPVTLFFLRAARGHVHLLSRAEVAHEEKLAAIERGVSVPMEPELSQAAPRGAQVYCSWLALSVT